MIREARALVAPLGIPLLSAAVGRFQGQVGAFAGHHADQACYRCFVGDAFDAEDCDTCAEDGMLGAMAGWIGTFAALQAVKVLLEGTAALGEPGWGRLHILDGLERQVGFADDIEITLEANPGTFEQAKFRDYRSLGINRLSIGVQSFQEAKLKALGRIHNGDEAIRAADMARAAGFDNFNLDLMHGLPEQSIEDALYDLRTAIAQGPTHLSWYQLTMEPNTVFWSQPPQLPEDDILWDIQEAGQALLAEHGYRQYETSAYAQPGRQARHNLNYWTFGDFLGIGAGAHAKLSHADGRILRSWKTRLPKDYLDPAKAFRAGEKLLAADELPFEFLMNVLRLTDGVPAMLFTQRTGLPLDVLAKPRRDAEARGLLSADPARLVATPKGQLFLNDLLQSFLP